MRGRTAILARALTVRVLMLLLLGPAGFAAAQPVSDSSTHPAFSLSAGQIASSRTPAAVSLMFRGVGYLDFRVYRVKDPTEFFARLRDPHTLGSAEPVVPQEQTWLERLAGWKAERRDAIRAFFRRQFSHEYRAGRQAQAEARQITLRRTIRYNAFAQVPLLNPSQLVASWREILPLVRDAEARRIPLDLHDPGVYVVEAVNPPLKAYTIVLVSDLGLVAKTAPGQLLLFVANRFSGQPVGGCDVEVVGNQQVIGTGVTDPDGIWEARLGENNLEGIVAVARCGAQVVATDPGSWTLDRPSRELVGYIYTDKPIYRPGQTVRLKGVLRSRVEGRLVAFDRKQAEVVVSDSNDKVVLREQQEVDEFGAVHTSLALGRGAALGYYTIRINSGDQEATESFEVQEYRKPEFEVTATAAGRFVLQGGKAMVSISARYYFGQPVAGAEVKYVVHRQPYFSPWRWRSEGEDEEEGRPQWWFGGEEARQGTLRLNDQGTAELSIPLEVDEKGRDYSARIEARVTDASSREVSGNTIVHATYGRFLVTAVTDRYVYAPGSPTTLNVRAVDYTGRPQAGVKVSVWLEQLAYNRGRWQEPGVTRLQQSTVETDQDGRATWETAIPTAAGDYRFKAAARDGDRFVQADADLWVPGTTVATESEYQYVELIADQSSYKPGDIAQFMIRGEGYEAFALVTKETQNVSYRRVVPIKPAGVIEVPITEDDVGDTWVNVAFLRDDRFYQAEKRVRVPATARQLQVTVTPDQAVSRPRQPASFTLKVADGSGRPVRAALSVGVIDEAVYGVKPDTTPDPLRFFYRREYSRVGTQFSRQYWFIGYSGRQELLLTRRRRPLTLADFKGERPVQPQVRKDFPDAIYWNPNVVTDASGTARVQVAYPDSLTTWRLTARAVTADTLVGTAMARTTTTKDLITRVITPRFLTEGDRAAVPVIVHNYLASARPVTVSLKAEGVEPRESDQTSTVQIAQAGESRLDWHVQADRVGSATFTATATTDTASDAVELSIPVLPFGLRRQVGAAGSILGPGEGSASLTIPDSANPAVRTIRVALAPSLAGPVLGALDFLTSYPYGCTEQTLSSFLPNLMALRALTELKLAPTERLQALDRQMSEGLRQLYEYQHADGGWGWWTTDESSPFMTAYALYGLVEASHAGYRIEERRINAGVRGLTALFGKYPRAVPDLKAYMLYVLGLATPDSTGKGPYPVPDSFDRSRALDEIWASRDRMSPYGKALLLMTLDRVKDGRGDQLARDLAGEARTKGDLAWWSVEHDPLLEDFGDASVEATAFVVKALVARDPRSPVLAQAVRWLLLNRNYGTYWSSTKQTAMVLYGLLDYMRARNEGTSDSTVDVIINGAVAATRTFTAASVASPEPILVAAPGRSGANGIRLVKRGAGALYWSATAEYFDRAGPLERTGSHRLALVRQYFTLTPVHKEGRIVYREAPLRGPVSPGDQLLVRLTAAGSTDWRYLVIEDPIPAGAEPIQQRQLYELERHEGSSWDSSHREYRDDRVVIFQEDFRQGRYEFLYLLKAITPGTFRAMPAQISAMYIPESTASSDAQTLVIGAEAPSPAGSIK
jgi:uncharacterized protein YfaS (alpha-2-macroglobulin family)